MEANEERKQILDMLAEGKITTEEAGSLLDAFQGIYKGTDTEPSTGATGKKARFMLIRVTDLNNQRKKVNIKLPMSLVQWGIKMGGKFGYTEVEGLNFEDLVNKEMIEAGMVGPLVDVVDEQTGEHVEISLE